MGKVLVSRSLWHLDHGWVVCSQKLSYDLLAGGTRSVTKYVPRVPDSIKETQRRYMLVRYWLYCFSPDQ